MKLDVIIPTYNEEDNVNPMYQALTETLKDINYNIIFVNDGSTDSTQANLNVIYNKDKKHVKIISFSRNFGKDAAMYAGLEHSTAEYTVIIDADLQQNPKLLLTMLKYLEKNPDTDVVCMTNDYADQSEFSSFLKRSFYKTINKLSDQHFVNGASDFRMFTKPVVKAILKLAENNRFTKGIFSWVGFNTHYMPYKVENRTHGTSKFNLRKQLSYGWDGIMNFSTKPLRIATILGTIISIVSFVYLIEILFETIITGKDIPGYASMMCIILLLGGIELLVLGIIGEYISRTYLEAKKRPVYLEKETLGFDNDIL